MEGRQGHRLRGRDGKALQEPSSPSREPSFLLNELREGHATWLEMPYLSMHHAKIQVFHVFFFPSFMCGKRKEKQAVMPLTSLFMTDAV